MDRRNCDLVMKGGVTSGVVYPDAIFEISRVFDLKSIGGTSAGAIAAAIAAAAQYRRVRCQHDPSVGDPESGFARLRDIPEYLGEEDHLFRLFAPNHATKALFRIIVDLFAPKRSLILKLSSLIRAYPINAAVGLIPAAGYLFAISQLSDSSTRLVHYVLALLVAIGGTIAFSVAGLAWDLLRDLPRNYFGLVTGVDDAEPSNDLALCTWLTRELEQTAGLEVGKTPLTFGMLWDPTKQPTRFAIEQPTPVPGRAVNLQMVTTSLTEGRPYQFPTRTNRYHFKPDELRRFFPEHVVEWMVKSSRSDATTFPDLVPLPPISDLPIIVATRMSLSFPILLSAVPLHAVDRTDADPQLPQTVWFSDGGLTSNFPIAMFDSPLPSWPTLALNLGAFGPRTPANGIVMSQVAGQGRLSRFVKISGLSGFFAAIFNALQNWNDNMQSTVPGIRDRIVTIAMHPEEGGLNLNMNSQMIEALRQRGREAAKALIDRFAEPSALAPDTKGLSWESHRWTRFRVAMTVLQDYLGRFADAYDKPQSGDVLYSDLIADETSHTVPRVMYEFLNNDETRQKVADLARHIRDTGAMLAGAPDLDSKTPLPSPALVQRPQLDR